MDIYKKFDIIQDRLEEFQERFVSQQVQLSSIEQKLQTFVELMENVLAGLDAPKKTEKEEPEDVFSASIYLGWSGTNNYDIIRRYTQACRHVKTQSRNYDSTWRVFCGHCKFYYDTIFPD
jgi:hypothetical protein